MEYNEKKIDIKENKLLQKNKKLLSILLEDKTTKRNLIWATDNYKKYGKRYKRNCSICIDLITGDYGDIIKPRVKKEQKEQQIRIRDKAEVFSSSWICNTQNNLVDDDWFGYKGAFNTEINKGWKTSNEKVRFPIDENKTWKEYVILNRLEVACGEAPYLTSRYDVVSGKYIEVKDRIGFLDRKLRVVNENIDSEEEWIKWSMEAVKSIYGYDWQGDNVLLARQNILYTVIEFYKYKFNKLLGVDLLMEYAKIISWNIWQMDGITMTVPFIKTKPKSTQISFFSMLGEEKSHNEVKQEPIFCKIKDWKSGRVVTFKSIVKGG